MHELIREIADNDRAHDPYGAGMQALSAVCDALSAEGESVPREAAYRPSVFGPNVDDDDVRTVRAGMYPHAYPGYFVDGYVPNLSVADAQYAARILSRYLDWVESAGRSY